WKKIDEAIARGVALLEKTQNKDGSWGTGTETHGTEIMSMVPGSHDAFRIGTTALCVMALREMSGVGGAAKAHDRGLEYLRTAPDAKRDDGELIYNSWAHIYVVQAMAEESLANPKGDDPRIDATAKRNLERMVRYATYMAAGP